jgi:hypothetical protein
MQTFSRVERPGCVLRWHADTHVEQAWIRLKESDITRRIQDQDTLECAPREEGEADCTDSQELKRDE